MYNMYICTIRSNMQWISIIRSNRNDLLGTPTVSSLNSAPIAGKTQMLPVKNVYFKPLKCHNRI